MAKRVTAQEEIDGLRETLSAFGALLQKERGRADRAEAVVRDLFSQPSREQIAEAWDRAREDTSIPRKRSGSMRPVDAFEAGFHSALALIQNGAER